MTTQLDPLAIYRIGKKGIPQSLQAPDPFEEESFNENDDPLAAYRVKPPEITEHTLKDTPIILGGVGARAVETGIGSVGNLQKSFGSLLDLIIGVPTEYISGKKHPKLREFLRDPNSVLGEHREMAEELERSSNQPGETSIFTEYPTSEDIRESITKPASKQLSGDENLLEPRSNEEKFAQEFTQDLVNLTLPGSGVHSWLGRIGLATAGNTAKEITKQLGFSPSSQELAKLGTLGILSLARIGNAPQFARRNYRQVTNSMPRGVRFNSTPLQNNLNNLRSQEWYRVGNPASTRAARELINEVQQIINVNGTVPIQDAIRMREVINEAAENLGAFAVDRAHRGAHVAHVNEVRRALIDGMEQTIGRQYPNWWHTYQDANQAFAITQRSSAIGNFIANNYAKPLVSDAGKILFGNALSKGAAGVAKLGIAGAGIASGVKVIELGNRITRSPTLRRYYQQVLQCSLRGDGIAMSNALRKFDEESLKEEKQEKSLKILRPQNPYRK